MNLRNIRLLVCLSLCALIGCGAPAPEKTASHDDHDEHGEHGEHGEHHDDHDDEGEHHEGEPETFAEAFEAVSAMKTKICKAFKDGTPDDAHAALHDVGHLLEELPELAAKGGELSEEQVSKMNAAVEALFDGFGKLDSTMHGGKEVNVEDLESKLTTALEDLKGAVE